MIKTDPTSILMSFLTLWRSSQLVILLLKIQHTCVHAHYRSTMEWGGVKFIVLITCYWFLGVDPSNFYSFTLKSTSFLVWQKCYSFLYLTFKFNELILNFTYVFDSMLGLEDDVNRCWSLVFELPILSQLVQSRKDFCLSGFPILTPITWKLVFVWGVQRVQNSPKLGTQASWA